MRALLTFVVLTALLAGCTSSGGPDPVTVLQDDHTVGERLFSHGWQPFLGPITAPIQVGDEVHAIGVRFSGRLGDADSGANLTLIRPDGSEGLVLRGAAGLEDDTTTIIEDFIITETTPAKPGEWKLRIDEHGTMERVTIDIHGVPATADPVEQAFEVPRDGRIALSVHLAGWGETPDSIRVERGDGTVVATIPVDRPRTTVQGDIDVEEGTHRIVAEVPGWGGRIMWQGILR